MDVDKAAADGRTLDVLEQIAALLDCQLERGALDALLQLVRAGCNPEALAKVVKDLKQRAEEDAERSDR